MTWLRNTMMCGICPGAAMLALILASGCQSYDSSPPPHSSTARGTEPHQSSPVGTTTTAPAANLAANNPDVLRAGDALLITFSGVEHPPDKYDGRIRDDGKIILTILPQSIQAAGKTAAQLQDEIHDLYVPTYFLRLTVSVNTEGRYFFVRGEVKKPDRYVYTGQMSLLKAIAAAGDFTDFAKKTKVQIMRVDGKIDTVNCNKAKRNPKLDLPIFPGDNILVPRRII